MRPAYNASTNYQKGSTLEIIDAEDEFKPLDEQRIEFIVGLATDIKDIAQHSNLGDIEKQIIELASHQMLVMVSMTLAGYDLYTQHIHHAIDLYEEASKWMDRINATDPGLAATLPTEAMEQWEAFVEEVDSHT